MGSGWQKFAILGSTYARALQNRAVRTHGVENVVPSTFAATAAQPRARFDTDLSSYARQRGALAPTPQSRGMADLARRIPWADVDHTTDAMSAKAPARFDRFLEQRGLVHNTPAGQPTTQDLIRREFGTPAQTAQPGTAAGSPKAMMRTQPGAGILPPAAVTPHPRFPALSPFQHTVRTGSILPMAAGIGIPLAIGGGILASKPGIRADIANRFNAPGDIHQKDVAQEIPAEVQAQAQRAHQALTERGINPAGLRIAVDAPSGAGKTVLSKALASQMGLRHHGLDWRPNLRFHQLMGGGDIEKTPYAPHAGEILEHQQLLRSYDPELFDAAIHIHKDAAAIKAQVLKRGRSARTHDLLDYDKSIDVGRKAFETLDGDAIDLGGGVMMKLRPQAGWGNQLDQRLAAGGIDPSGLTRHQKLLSLYSGKREERGAGWTPYMKNPFSGGETAAIAGSIPLGMLAARALAHR